MRGQNACLCGHPMVAVSFFHPCVRVTLQIFSKRRRAVSAARRCYSDPNWSSSRPIGRATEGSSSMRDRTQDAVGLVGCAGNAVPAGGERRPVLYLQTQFNEHHGHFSADGRWMAYSSDESGRWEVYVRAFPSEGARGQISRDGGVEPRWGRDGKELFYVSPDGTLMTVAVQPAGAFQASAPRALFKTRVCPGKRRPAFSG